MAQSLQQRVEGLKKSLEGWQARFDEAETVIRKGEGMKKEAMRMMDMHIANLQLLQEMIDEQNTPTDNQHSTPNTGGAGDRSSNGLLSSAERPPQPAKEPPVLATPVERGSGPKSRTSS